MATQPDREKALGLALSQIDKQFGKGSVMRLGERPTVPMAVIPTGSIALDIALGIGGLPRGRVVEIYGPESSGKCLTADTYVWTDQGLETVAELFTRCGAHVVPATRVTDISAQGVRVVNEHGELEPVAALTHNNRKPVLKLTLRSGRTITATRNHPLRVADGQGGTAWRPVEEIRAGDVLVSAAFGAIEAAGGDGVSEDEAVLLGYLVARRALLGADAAPAARSDGSATWGDGAEQEHARLLAQQVAVAVGHPEETVVPHRVRAGGNKAQRAFLSAIFEAAGRIEPAGVALSTVNEQLAREVQLLLLGLSVPATLHGAWSETAGRRHWRIGVGAGVLARFSAEVGLRSAERRDELARLLVDDTPARPVPGAETRPGYVYEEVVRVVDAGTRPTFDVVLPATHSFLANGICSHNTTVALHAVASAQAAGGIAAFIDAEHALDPDYARALGVDTDALLVSQPDTGEQALEIADMLIRSGALDIVVIDSVAALVPRAEIEGEMGDSHVGLQARLMSQALRKITGALNSSNTTAIFINQLREKIGVMFGNPETTTGGRALKFYASVRLDVRRIESLKDGSDVVGNRTRVKVVKNKVAAPFKQAEFDIMYGKGISREGSLIDVGVEQGIIRKSGAWYTYEGDQLGQGKENARTFLREHSDAAAEIEKRILEKIGVSMAASDGLNLPPVDF